MAPQGKLTMTRAIWISTRFPTACYPGYYRFFFSRVQLDASVLAVGQQIFARVTIRTWPQPENAHKKSLAPRVKVCVYFLHSRLGMPLIITPFIEHELFYFGFHTGSVTSVVGWEHRRSKTLIDRQMLWEGSTNRLWQTTTCVSMATFNRRYYQLNFDFCLVHGRFDDSSHFVHVIGTHYVWAACVVVGCFLLSEYQWPCGSNRGNLC